MSNNEPIADATEELVKGNDALNHIEAALRADRSERELAAAARKRSDRLARAAFFMAMVLAIIDLVAVVTLGFIVVRQNRTESILRQTRQAQIQQECSTASSRAHPRLLENSAELQRALDYTRRCAELNGVTKPTIKLPPK